MKQESKIFILSILIIGLFIASFALFFNDLINYSMITFSITIVLAVFFCTIVFAKKDARSVFLKNVQKTLKDYDSDIIYSDGECDISDKDILFVKNMKDLYVASSDEKEPIVYVSEEHSATFLVKSGKELLVYIIKENEEDISDYEHKILKQIENNNKSRKVLLKDINDETIIKLDQKFYKVTPMKTK